ncbi:MAG: hypothetical protein L6Q63_04015 [Giesbergeria sp.]|nr:hypothetical protein [Giesbergeria sp.]
MTLRDYFAAAAIPAVAANLQQRFRSSDRNFDFYNEVDLGILADGCYLAADAMLQCRMSGDPTSAPQQEAQEPVMIYHGGCTIDCGEHGHHNVELLRMIPAGSKLYTAPQPSPASQGDALPREEFAWLVVREACETEPADEDDPECIRILRRDLKSSVLAAFLRHDAARAAQEGE